MSISTEVVRVLQREIKTTRNMAPLWGDYLRSLVSGVRSRRIESAKRILRRSLGRLGKERGLLGGDPTIPHGSDASKVVRYSVILGSGP